MEPGGGSTARTTNERDDHRYRRSVDPSRSRQAPACSGDSPCGVASKAPGPGVRSVRTPDRPISASRPHDVGRSGGATRVQVGAKKSPLSVAPLAGLADAAMEAAPYGRSYTQGRHPGTFRGRPRHLQRRIGPVGPSAHLCPDDGAAARPHRGELQGRPAGRGDSRPASRLRRAVRRLSRQRHGGPRARTTESIGQEAGRFEWARRSRRF
jgi:hypothetical protein